MRRRANLTLLVAAVVLVVVTKNFLPPVSTAPAVLQTTRSMRQRGASLDYHTLQDGSMSQAEVEAEVEAEVGRAKRRFG